MHADGRARRLLSYEELLDTIHHTFLKRNSAEFRWAEGDEQPIDVDGEDVEGERL
jgi:hypothetical protein